MGRKKKSERQAYLKGRWCDGITEFGEKEWHEGRMSRDEVNSGYRMFGKTHNMPDLLPHMTPEMLKSAIKGRRARGSGTSAGPAQEKPAWGESSPSPPAVASDGNVIQATKRFGQKALAKLKKTA